MTLCRKRVHDKLAVSGEHDQYLVNSSNSGTDHRTDQFTKYLGTCVFPLHLPTASSNLTVPIYWETSSQVYGKGKVQGKSWLYLLEMGVVDDLVDIENRTWISGPFGSRCGWSVGLFDCGKHQGFCTQVWGKEEWVGNDCLSTTPWPSAPENIEIRLGIVADVERERLGFIDVNKGKILHWFRVTLSRSVFPVFGVKPDWARYEIKMRLFSGGDIALTDRLKRLIQTA